MLDMEHYGWLADEKDVEEYKDNIRKTKSSELQLDDFETIKNEFINNQFEITKKINVTDRPQAFVEILARAFLCGINGAAITHISGELTKEYSHERCFCELIQNIDDCTYSGTDCPKANIKFDKENNTITLSYNEKGFNFTDVNGLCQYNETSKMIFEKKEENSNVYYLSVNQAEKSIEQSKEDLIFSYYQTGEKGIGFKAIYQITKRVHIKSNDFDFYIINEHFNNEKTKKIPIPMWNYSSNNDKKCGTEITLYLKDTIKDKFEELKDNIINKYFCGKISKDVGKVNLLSNNNILFTKQLSEVCVDTDEGYKYTKKEGKIDSIDNTQLEPDEELDYWEGIYDDKQNRCSYAEQKVTFEYSSKNQSDDKITEIEITKFLSTVEFDEDTVRARYQEKFESDGYNGELYARKQTRNITFAVEKENDKIVLEKEGGFYTTLPFECKTNAPFSVDAPFILNKSRSRIYFPKNDEDGYAQNILKWNKETLKKVREVYIKFLLQNRGDIEFIKNMIYKKGISEEEIDISKHSDIELTKYLEETIWKVPYDEELIRLSGKTEEYKSIRDVYFFDNTYYYELPQYEDLAKEIDGNSQNIADKVYIEGSNNILKFNNILKPNNIEAWNRYVKNVINKGNYLQCITTELIEALKSSGMKCCSELKIFKLESSLVSQDELDGIIVWENEKSSVGCVHTTYTVLPNISIDNENIKEFFKDSVIDKEQKEALQIYIKNSIDEKTEEEEVICKGYKSVLLGANAFEIDFSEIDFKFIDYFGINDESDWFSKYLWKLDWYEREEEIQSKWDNMVISCCANCKDRLPEVASRIFAEVKQDDLKTKILCALLRKDEVNNEGNKSPIRCDRESISFIFEAIDKYFEINKKSDLGSTYKKIENYFQFMIDDENPIEGDKESEDLKKCAVAILKELIEENNKVQLNVYSRSFRNENYNYVKINEMLICKENKFIDGIKDYISDFEEKDKSLYFQNRLELLKMKDSISKFESGKEKEFIESLQEYRKIQCECGFDVGNLLEELQNNGKVWAEILQNINDARETLPDKNTTVNVVINEKNRTLTIEYDEKGFDFKDIKGITDLGNGSKANSSQTGEKGIGFKSVYRWAYRVEIHSNGFHFEIGPESELKDNIRVENCTVPRWLDDSKTDISKTKMILYLKKETDCSKVENEIANEDEYLCVDNIGNFDLKKESSEGSLFVWSRDNDVKNNYYYYEKLLKDCDYFKNVKFSEWIKSRQRWKVLTDEEINNLEASLKIQYYFKKDIPKEPKKYIWKYATLPLIKENDKYPAIIVNAPFATDISRNNTEGSAKNKEYTEALDSIIKSQFANAVMEASNKEQKYFKEKEGGILFYLIGLDEYLDEIKDKEIFSCYCKDNENQIVELKKALMDITVINDHLIYSLLENLEKDKFITAINKICSYDNNVDKKQIRDSFILSIMKDKAVLKKTDMVNYDEIDEIENKIKIYNKENQKLNTYNQENQELNTQNLIESFIKELKLPDEWIEVGDENEFMKFLKSIWKKIYKEWGDFDRTCPIYPFIDKNDNGGKVTKFAELKKDFWYFDIEMKHYSTDYYKIIDLDWLSKRQNESTDRNDALKVFDTTRDEEIKKYSKEVEKKHLEELLEKEQKYTDEFWKILKKIYDLKQGGEYDWK